MSAISAVRAEVELVDAPRIAGLRFRRPLGPQDYLPMLAVYTASAAADGLDEVMTEADVANFVENPIGSDPTQDYLIAEIKGRIIAYAWVSHRLEAGGDEIHWHRGYVHPAWRRRGLGTAMVRQAWRRGAERPLSPDPSGARLMHMFALETETGANALAQSLGYSPVRYSYSMRRDLDQPIAEVALPDGVEIRPARPEHFRAIWEAEREAFQDHWGYAPWPEEAFQRFLDFPHYDPSLWRVAWDGDQVAGMVLSYINAEENDHFGRRRGYTEDIAVRQPWRRRGLASALIARSLAALKERGMSEAALAVDSENRTGALRVYERLGYTPVQRWTIYRRPLPEASG